MSDTGPASGTADQQDPRNIWIALLVGAVPLLLYLRTVGFGFIDSWDDASYVLENPLITALTWSNLQAIFAAPHLGHYSPLQLLSYALEFPLWGRDAGGYHAVNALLHSANAVLLFALVLRLTRDRAVAALVALLFAVHPLNVENVAWIAERKTLLSALFSFACLYAYLDWRGRGGRARYALFLALGLLAILSKATAVALPALLWAYEWALGERPRRWLAPLPLLAVALWATWMTLAGHVAGDAIEAGALAPDVLFGTVYPTSVVLWWRYIGLLLWPAGLSGFYEATLHHSFLAPAVFFSLAGWLAVAWLALFRGGAQLRFWFLWFAICFAPVSNIIPINTYMADRYMYLPAIGWFVALGLGLRAAHGWLVRRGLRQATPGVLAVCAVLVLGYAAAAWDRTEVWRDEVTFWEDTVRKSPSQYKPRLNLGTAYERRGRLEEAEASYRAALAIWPQGDAAIRNLRMIEARRRFREGGSQSPSLHP